MHSSSPRSMTVSRGHPGARQAGRRGGTQPWQGRAFVLATSRRDGSAAALAALCARNKEQEPAASSSAQNQALGSSRERKHPSAEQHRKTETGSVLSREATW